MARTTDMEAKSSRLCQSCESLVNTGRTGLQPTRNAGWVSAELTTWLTTKPETGFLGVQSSLIAWAYLQAVDVISSTDSLTLIASTALFGQSIRSVQRAHQSPFRHDTLAVQQLHT